MTLLAIIAATFVSEDLTCISVGLLLSQQRVDPVVAFGGCFLGILAGDIGLWLAGRILGARILQWERVRRLLPYHSLERFAEWFDQRGVATVLAARFIPGTRLPVYLAAGAIGRRASRLILIAILAGLVWTPLLVGTVACVGEPIVAPLEHILNSAWLAAGIGLLVFVIALHVGRKSISATGRAELMVSISRLWRWEFWPAWVFYLPLVAWIGWLALRHRGISTMTAANPGIPHSGIVGESKLDILRQLPPEYVARTSRIDADEPNTRVCAFRELLACGWNLPLILKPDVGERGAGVVLVSDVPRAVEYLSKHTSPVLVQQYHPGPFEAGVFYVRHPGEPSGRILSITDKHFPQVVGDGASSVADLIRRHERYRMQAKTFLQRMNGTAERIPVVGEIVRLAAAGNHCQGTKFVDGEHLRTDALERSIDGIAKHFEGFYIGRFDIRYRNVEAFKAGRDLTIVELNGASSESTNLYDPSFSLLRAYRTLFQQWRILFEIGLSNRDAGVPTTSVRRLCGLLLAHRRRPQPVPLSD